MPRAPSGWSLIAMSAGIGISLATGMIAGRAQASSDPAPVKSEGGKYVDARGDPTFKVGADGTVDWYTFQGYIRYTARPRHAGIRCQQERHVLSRCDLCLFARPFRRRDRAGAPTKHDPDPPEFAEQENAFMR
jgi:hypothetical protein